MTRRARGIEPAASVSSKRACIVGADGVHSSIARLVGAWPLIVGHHRTGRAYGYWENLPADGFYWGYRASASVGMIPTNGNAEPALRQLAFAALRGDRPWQTCRVRIDGADPRDLPGSRREAVGRAAGRTDSRLRRAIIGFIRKSAGSGWALVGRRGIFQGSADRARYHRRASRRRVPGARIVRGNPGGLVRLRDDTLRTVEAAST